jgi:hypothetical protein
METTIQTGSGLPTTPEIPLKFHDRTITPTMNLNTTEQLIRRSKLAATSGDVFMTGKDFIIEEMANKR